MQQDDMDLPRPSQGERRTLIACYLREADGAGRPETQAAIRLRLERLRRTWPEDYRAVAGVRQQEAR